MKHMGSQLRTVILLWLLYTFVGRIKRSTKVKLLGSSHLGHCSFSTLSWVPCKLQLLWKLPRPNWLLLSPVTTTTSYSTSSVVGGNTLDLEKEDFKNYFLAKCVSLY